MSTASDSARDRMIRELKEQPDDMTFEQLMRELAVSGMIERGLSDHREGRTISNEEMQPILQY